MAVLALYIAAIIIGSISPVPGHPNQLFAASGNWNQTTFAGSGDGTYTSTQPYSGNDDVGLSGVSSLSNAGGGSWQYKRPITVTNSSGGALTDYQVQVNPFNDATNGDQVGYRYEANLQGSWHLNEGSGAAISDMSGNSNAGTITIGGSGTQTTTTQAWTNGANGRFSSSLNFDGTDDYATIPASSSLNNLTSATWETWVYPKLLQRGDSNEQKIIFRDGPWTSNASVQTTWNNGQFSVAVYVGGWKAAAAGGYSINNWYHVAGTLDGVNLKLYVNGQNVATTPCGSLGNGSTSWLLAKHTGSGYEFTGQIDETKVYSRALSATEMTNRYNSNSPKVRHDYQDLRFGTISGSTEYNFWQETDGKYWVKIPSLPAGDTTIYMFYGNSVAGNSSSGASTFIQYHGSASTDFHDSNIVPPNNIYYRARVKTSGNNVLWGLWRTHATGDDDLSIQTYNEAGTNRRYAYSRNEASATTIYENPHFSSDTYRTLEIKRYSSEVHYFVDGDEIVAGISTNLPDENMGLDMFIASGTALQDFSFASSYTVTEPTHATPGSETGTYVSSGSFVSLAIPTTVAHQGKVYAWGDFTFVNTLNGQTLTYDVLDSATGDPVGGYTGITTSPTSLAGISSTTYPALKVRANFSGSGSATAMLNSWDVAYSYDIAPPTVPTALTIGSVTSSTVPLSWTASTDGDSGMAGYEVQRAPDSSGNPGTWAAIASGPCSGVVAGTSCTDNSSLSSNTKYWYRVRAKDNAANYSGWAGETNVDSNVVGLWRFNEGTGGTTADSSGNNNTGTMYGTSYWTSGNGGKFGESLTSSGSNYVYADDSNTLDITSAITIEAWVNFSNLGVNWNAIVSKRDASASEVNYAFRTGSSGSADELEFFYYGGGAWHVYTTNNANLTTGGWYHLAVACTGSNPSSDITIYKNGTALTGSWTVGTGAAALVADNNKVGIGRDGEYTDYFRGKIDEVRISGVKRSGTDIQNYYNEAYPNPKSATTLPGAPTSPTATAASTTEINPVSWTAPAGGADHYHMRSSSDAYATLKYNSSGTSTSESGLSANTQYTYRIWSVNAGDVESSTYAEVSRYTWPNAPTGQTATADSSTQITVNWSAGAGGTDHYHVRSSSDSYATIKYDNTGTSWPESGLSPNTQYTYRIYAVNADNVENTGYITTSKYTLTNIPASASATAASTSQIDVSWTAPNPGGANHYHVRSSSDAYGSLKYDNTGLAWSETTLSPNTQYTYRVWGVNADGVESATYATVSKYTWPNAPTGQTASAASSSQIDVSWSAGAGGADHYHVRSSSDAYATVKYNDSTPSWSETLLSPNTQYTYRIYAVNADSVENSSYVTASAYTITNTPVLNSYTSPTNNNKPPITNSSTPDASFANMTARLYRDDDGTYPGGSSTLYATTTANGSGVFTFVVGDYSSALPDGTNVIFARVLNGGGSESPDSNTLTLEVDTDPPAPPSAASAWTDAGKGTPLVDNDWNGHNNIESVYFEWSGHNDMPIPPNLGVDAYWVYFGSNGSALPRTDGQLKSGSTPSATKTLASPVSGTDYYLRIQSVDAAGNISPDGSVTTLFTYKFDNTPPSSPTTITPTPAGWSTTNSFDFQWTNWTEAHSGMDFYLYVRKETAGGDTYEAFDPINRKVTDVTNPINLDNAEALYTGINWIRVYAVDKAGNTSSVYGSTPYFYSGTVAGPTIASTPDFNTVNSFSFTLTKPGGITAVGYYCGVETPVSPSNSTYIKLSELPKAVTINGKSTNATLAGDVVTLSAFAAAKQNGVNNIYCATEDDLGNIGWSSATSDSFTVSTVAPDVPQNIKITDASDRGTSNWALTVGWTALTGQPADFDGYEVWRCTSGCGNDANYSKVATVSTNIYSEAGLSNVTDYYYKVKSKDNVGNTSALSASVHKIPTGKYSTPPTITSGPTASPKALSVTVGWTTNRASNTVVQYGTTNAYGQEASKSTEAVTDHNIEILGLTPGVTYHFRIQSLDADRDYDPNTAFSTDYTFTTLAAPGISDVQVSEIRLTSAIVTWKTTSSATSKILYGTTAAYGQTYTDISASQTTTHTVKLENLSDSTTYNFKIQGTDVDGNALSSDNYVFTTLTFPKLSNLKVEQVPNTPTSTIKVTFDSNVSTSTLVTAVGKNTKDTAKYDLERSHEIKISGLLDDSTYTVTVRGRDQYGNEATPITATYKTDFDTRPPLISDVTTETSITGFGVDAKGQIVVSWTTDEPATSQIEYGPGVTGTDYTGKTQEDTSLTENHVVIISDLKPSAPYHFRIISKDKSENTGISADNSVLTQQANESILDLIIKSLQSTIGWIFNVFRK